LVIPPTFLNNLVLLVLAYRAQTYASHGQAIKAGLKCFTTYD
jgi:hypothetical protein